jgi:hypothetical protein
MTTNTDTAFFNQVSQRTIDGVADALRAGQQEPQVPGTDAAAAALRRKLLADNAPLLERSAAAWSCGGSFSWATAFVWGTLTSSPTLDFKDWGSLRFSGSHWGVGIGGGISYMIGLAVVDPQEVIGDVEYTMAFAAQVVTITFWRSGRLLLSISGPCLAVGAHAVVGTGKFTRA